MKNAIILLSGGLDSATVLALARAENFICHCLVFRYGQRHAVELAAATRVAEKLSAASWRIIDLDLRGLTNSALIAHTLPLAQAANFGNEIPNTYVPARNLLFLSYALGLAETLNAADIFIGVNAVDYSGYPDCRPEFIAAFEQIANLATVAGVGGKPFHIHAPLMNLSKAEIIQLGTRLGVDYALTHSCYDPDAIGRACGKCDSCRLRRTGFAAAGIDDPTNYQ